MSPHPGVKFLINYCGLPLFHQKGVFIVWGAPQTCCLQPCLHVRKAIPDAGKDGSNQQYVALAQSNNVSKLGAAVLAELLDSDSNSNRNLSDDEDKETNKKRRK
jgi:hypothetical protein